MMSPDDLPLLLTVREAAQLLRVGRDTAYQLARSQTIPVIRLGRQFRIPKAALLAYLERQAVGGVDDGPAR